MDAHINYHKPSLPDKFVCHTALVRLKVFALFLEQPCFQRDLWQNHFPKGNRFKFCARNEQFNGRQKFRHATCNSILLPFQYLQSLFLDGKSRCARKMFRQKLILNTKLGIFVLLEKMNSEVLKNNAYAHKEEVTTWRVWDGLGEELVEDEEALDELDELDEVGLGNLFRAVVVNMCIHNSTLWHLHSRITCVYKIHT